MKKGLGRGLDALFSIYQDDESVEVKPKQTIKQEVQVEPVTTKVETSQPVNQDGVVIYVDEYQ